MCVCARARTCGCGVKAGWCAACCSGAVAQTLATFIYLLFFFGVGWVGGSGGGSGGRRRRVCCELAGPSGFKAYATCAPPPAAALHTSYVLRANLFRLLRLSCLIQRLLWPRKETVSEEISPFVPPTRGGGFSLW
jgi:hypothetical protein